MHKPLRCLWLLFLNGSLLLYAATVSNAQTLGVYFGVETSTGNDTLVVGDTARIYFTVDPNGRSLTGLIYALGYTFSNGNIIGPLAEDVSVFRTAESATFEYFSWVDEFRAPTDPDTTLCALLDFGGSMLTGYDSVPVWYIEFTPSDTGTIVIDSIFIPPSHSMYALDPGALFFPVYWQPKTITVVPPCGVEMTGDLTGDGKITAADIIRAVCFGFACDPATPCESATADVNCDGALTITDIILLVDYAFKSGPPPCNVCSRIWDGTWECP